MRFKIQSNITQIINEQLKIIERLETLDMESSATNMLALVSERVQNRGQATDGSRFGNYSLGYSKVREEENLQTGYIDLTRTGQMMGSTGSSGFGLIVDGDTVGLGFRSDKEAEKAERNKQRYGEFILPDQREEEDSLRIIERKIDEIIKG